VKVRIAGLAQRQPAASSGARPHAREQRLKLGETLKRYEIDILRSVSRVRVPQVNRTTEHRECAGNFPEMGDGASQGVMNFLVIRLERQGSCSMIESHAAAS
jgi:hypothetical protein